MKAIFKLQIPSCYTSRTTDKPTAFSVMLEADAELLTFDVSLICDPKLVVAEVPIFRSSLS